MSEIETELYATDGVDIRPGKPSSKRGGSPSPVDLGEIPQLTDEEKEIIADPTKDGTKEHKVAHEKAMRIRDLIRWEHGIERDVDG